MSNQIPPMVMEANLSGEELIEEFSSYHSLIETVISSLDADTTAMVSHRDEGSLWKFQYGSVEVFVQLTGDTDDDLLTVWATVLKLPAKRLTICS